MRVRLRFPVRLGCLPIHKTGERIHFDPRVLHHEVSDVVVGRVGDDPRRARPAGGCCPRPSPSHGRTSANASLLVVSDVHHRGAELALDALELEAQRQARLHVERAHGLVEQDDLGFSASVRAMDTRCCWPPRKLAHALVEVLESPSCSSTPCAISRRRAFSSGLNSAHTPRFHARSCSRTARSSGRRCPCRGRQEAPW